MDMIRCPGCGVKNRLSLTTCVKCGGLLPTPGEAKRIEEQRVLREMAPHLSDEERQRIAEEERLRKHLRDSVDSSEERDARQSTRTYGDEPRPAPPEGHEPQGDMVRAAVLGLVLGLVGVGVGLIYGASADRDKKVFGRQLMAWSAAGMMALFVLLTQFPALSPTPPLLAECAICSGDGIVDCPICVSGIAQNPLTGGTETCTFCNGVGESTCTFCNGTGKAP